MSAVLAQAPAPDGVRVTQRRSSRSVSARSNRRRTIYLSHSSRELFTTCGRKYRYSYVDRLQTQARSSNLGFGSAVHRGCEVFLYSQATGEPGPDPIAEFNRVWDEFCDSHVVSYSSIWDRESMRSSGTKLVEKFMEDWLLQGLIVVLDLEGKPIIERQLKIELPNDVVFTAVIDVLAMTPDGRVLVIDIKTPGQAAFDGFSELSEQLLGYQVVVDAHAKSLGIDQVDGRAFYELLKKPIPKTPRGTGPIVLPFHPVARASEDEIRDWIHETLSIAEDIRNNRFPRRPGDAYASPCGMCDFSALCLNGDMTGICKKPPRQNPFQLPAPAVDAATPF